MNFDRPDLDMADVAPVTAYAIAHVCSNNPDFAHRIEGAWRAMRKLTPAEPTPQAMLADIIGTLQFDPARRAAR